MLNSIIALSAPGILILILFVLYEKLYKNLPNTVMKRLIRENNSVPVNL